MPVSSVVGSMAAHYGTWRGATAPVAMGTGGWHPHLVVGSVHRGPWLITCISLASSPG